MSTAVSEVINSYNKKPIAIEKNKTKPIAIDVVSEAIVDWLLNEYRDLHQAKDNGWHVTVIRILGVNKYEELARIARADGRFPQRYFTWLLNREMGL